MKTITLIWRFGFLLFCAFGSFSAAHASGSSVTVVGPIVTFDHSEEVDGWRWFGDYVWDEGLEDWVWSDYAYWGYGYRGVRCYANYTTTVHSTNIGEAYTIDVPYRDGSYQHYDRAGTDGDITIVVNLMYADTSGDQAPDLLPDITNYCCGGSPTYLASAIKWDDWDGSATPWWDWGDLYDMQFNSSTFLLEDSFVAEGATEVLARRAALAEGATIVAPEIVAGVAIIGLGVYVIKQIIDNKRLPFSYVVYEMYSPSAPNADFYYTGRTSGFGSKTAVLARRMSGHPYRSIGFNYGTINAAFTTDGLDYGAWSSMRGREQQIMDAHADQGKMINAIRGVAADNKTGYSYWLSSNFNWGVSRHSFTGSYASGAPVPILTYIYTSETEEHPALP